MRKKKKKNRAEHKRSLLMRNRTTDLFCESSWMTAGSACSRGSGREEPADWGGPPGGGPQVTPSDPSELLKINWTQSDADPESHRLNPADCRDLVVLEKNRGEEQIHNEKIKDLLGRWNIHQSLPVVYKDLSSVASPSVPLLLNITFLYTFITHFPCFWSFIHWKTRSTGVGVWVSLWLFQSYKNLV